MHLGDRWRVITAERDVATEDRARLLDRIERLRHERNAVILAHNYQRPEVQDIADFVGDSLGLSQQAAATDADVIVFCGVHFMAETAAILSPQKTVLLPDLEAGCSLAATIDADQLRAWKAQYPGAVVVSYVNTTAEVKALSDYCCTSSNAEAVIRSIPSDREILFCPDMFLGAHLERVTGRKLHVWMGECHVHAGIVPDRLDAMRREHPDAELLIHPECGCTSSTLYRMSSGDIAGPATVVTSTEGMVRRAAEFARVNLHRRDRGGDPPPHAGAVAGEAVPRRLGSRGVPLHEEDHAREGRQVARAHGTSGRGGSGDCGRGAGRHRSDAGDRPVGRFPSLHSGLSLSTSAGLMPMSASLA